MGIENKLSCLLFLNSCSIIRVNMIFVFATHWTPPFHTNMLFWLRWIVPLKTYQLYISTVLLAKVKIRKKNIIFCIFLKKKNIEIYQRILTCVPWVYESMADTIFLFRTKYNRRSINSYLSNLSKSLLVLVVIRVLFLRHLASPKEVILPLHC